jgi:hypothetical protein
MTAFTKVVCIGTQSHRSDGKARFNVYCKIEFSVDGKLSISGVEGPLPSGNARGGCVQIEMHMTPEWLSTLRYAEGWNRAKVAEFLAVWRAWHLNDMKAGTPEQEAELKRHTFPGYPVSHYDWAKETLRAAGLQPHNGYCYGSKWLRVEVPAEVVAFLRALPDSPTRPAWV